MVIVQKNILTVQQKKILYNKLQWCQHRIHEIELTNDKNYRKE